VHESTYKAGELMTILTVFKTEIYIGSIAIDAYTANQISSTTGKFINYLSGAGLAESIGLNRSTTLQNRLSEDLKAMLGAGFTTLQGQYKMESGGKSKLNLWDTTSAAIYYRYHDKQNNILAGAIVTALIATTLDIIIDDRFGRIYEQGAAEAKTNARLAGKITRRTLTDAIKEYLETNEVSENYRKFVYSNCSDKINRSLFGKTASKLCAERSCDRDELRSTHSAASLVLIDRIEGHAVRLIDRGLEPQIAVTDAIAFYS
jgi:hypothetical protein